MEKYNKKHLKKIQIIIEEKSGVTITKNRRRLSNQIGRMALLVSCLLCFVLLSAFAYVKFSSLNGDKLGFASAYQGEGRFEIVVINSSDQELKLQDKVKVMQWSTSKEVEGDNKKIKMENRTIAPHSQGIVSIDISEGYDVEAMEKDLQDGDWYYFVLTNNNFAFGQDWMCSFQFKTELTENVESRLCERVKEHTEEYKTEYESICSKSDLIDTNWSWPTVSQQVSVFYGEHGDGTYSDHINIAGTVGDEIYAVADGVVTETAFESSYGNVIIVDLGEGVFVKYGHLEKIEVSKGDPIQKDQVIATLGQTGMATGPNLSFSVIINGEEVNPLTAQ